MWGKEFIIYSSSKLGKRFISTMINKRKSEDFLYLYLVIVNASYCIAMGERKKKGASMDRYIYTTIWFIDFFCVCVTTRDYYIVEIKPIVCLW